MSVSEFKPVPRADPDELEANVAKLQEAIDDLRSGKLMDFALFRDYGMEGYVTSTSARIDRIRMLGVLTTLMFDINAS
jgi:hypothetical protein